jgi:hypothetical protein
LAEWPECQNSHDGNVKLGQAEMPALIFYTKYCLIIVAPGRPDKIE